jgi:hypothetical protein
VAPAREGSVPVPETPIRCEDFLRWLGVENRDDVKRIEAALEWCVERQAEEAKQQVEAELWHRERRSRRYALIYGLVATLIGGLITWSISALSGGLSAIIMRLFH